MIKYKDLSVPLKLGISGGLISLSVWGLSFLAGFIIGVMGY